VLSSAAFGLFHLTNLINGSPLSAALTQVGLRRKAVTKFGPDAGRLLFTSEGLEQATHRHVAEHRARRVVATGATSVRESLRRHGHRTTSSGRSAP